MVKSRTILLYPCTIVDFIRLLLLGGAVVVGALEEPELRPGFVALVGLSRFLDLFDGYLARKFDHTTRFGTLFDLLLDLTTQTVLWIASDFYLAPALLILEWAAGLYVAAFTMGPGRHWKTVLLENCPGFIRYYFSHHQRNFLSAYGNIAHFLFPVALYLGFSAGWLDAVLLPGLILYEVVTAYMLGALMGLLVRDTV